MSQFEEFKKKYKELYPSSYDAYDFMDDFFSNKNPLELELKEDNSKQAFDSYGNEDSTLNRVFYSKEFDIFVMFSGTRQSHVGEEWNEMKEVKPVTKTYETYE